MKLRVLESQPGIFRIVYQSCDEFWRYVYRYDNDGYLEKAEYTDITECMKSFKCIENLGLILVNDKRAVLFDDKT